MLVDRDKLRANCSLWFGPAGTFTPLHHDATNNLFCQIYGRKRVELISPLEPGLLDRLQGFYLNLDPPDAPLAGHPSLPEGARVYTVELAPGDALFIPVGWLHQVRSLDVSITLSMLAFPRPNAYRWYRPGFVGIDASSKDKR